MLRRRRLLTRGVGIGNASLIIAALDLQLVRLLRKSIAANVACPVLCPCDRLAIRSRLRAELRRRIEPRKVVHPTPRFDARPVIHPTPRIEPRTVDHPTEPVQPARKPGPCRPPWRVPLWEMTLQPPPNIKVHIYRPDVIHKGTLLDLFI